MTQLPAADATSLAASAVAPDGAAAAEVVVQEIFGANGLSCGARGSCHARSAAIAQCRTLEFLLANGVAP